MDQNVGNELSVVSLQAAADVVATGNGTGIDLQDYSGQAVFVVACGAATAGTNPTMDTKLQQSNDDGSTDAYADVSGGGFTQVTTVASLQKLVLNTDGLKRYVRLVKTLGGTASPSFPMSSLFVGTKRIPA